MPSIVTDNDLLYCEDGIFEKKDSLRLIEKIAVESEMKIQAGTLWPKSRKYYVPTTKANLDLLKSASENCIDIEFGIHFVVCSKEKVILEWYDASTDVMLITKEYHEQAIEKFANLVQQNYRFVNAG